MYYCYNNKRLEYIYFYDKDNLKLYTNKIYIKIQF